MKMKLVLALILGLFAGNLAQAQLTIGDFATLNDTFTFDILSNIPGVGSITPNDDSLIAGGLAFFDGNSDNTANLGTGGVLAIQETFTDLSGGNYELVFSATGGTDLAPAITIAQGTTSALVFQFGNNTAGSNPAADALDVLPGVSVDTAVLEVFNSTGAAASDTVPAFSLDLSSNPSFANNSFTGSFQSAPIVDAALFTQSEVRLTLTGSIVQPVPEPTSAALLGLATIGFVTRRRRS